MKSLEKIIKPYKKILDKVDYKSFDDGNLHPDVYLFQKWHGIRIPLSGQRRRLCE